ncbi:hypothetical protein JCM5296_002652 [Sporobolomyces johnsonii]
MARLLSLLGATVLAATTALAFTPSFSSSAQGTFNSTIQAGWRTDSGTGTLNQALTLLSNGTDTTPNSSYYGVVVYFNETLAVNQTKTAVPFIAFVSCDSNPSTRATFNLTSSSNNSTMSNSTVSSLNSTTSLNSTLAGNASLPLNSTTIVNSTFVPDVFSLAASMGASSVLLYSERNQSCALNRTALSDFNHTIPIFTSPSSQVTNLMISSQFGNVDAEYQVFNSTLIDAAAANLTAIIASNGTNGLPTEFLIATISASYKNDSSSGVVATIGRAPTATSSVRLATGTSRSTSTQSSGAEQRSWSGPAAVGTLVAAGAFITLMA